MYTFGIPQHIVIDASNYEGFVRGKFVMKSERDKDRDSVLPKLKFLITKMILIFAKLWLKPLTSILNLTRHFKDVLS